MQKEMPVSQLTRVGATTAKRLARLGIFTAGDLLYYFPFRYEDYSRVCLIKDVVADAMVTVKGKIELIHNKRSWRKKIIITEALMTDVSGSIRVIWFNQSFIVNILQPGDEVYLSGKVEIDALGPKFASPVYEKAGKNFIAHTARLVPIYPLTAGVTQKQIRFLMSQVLPLFVAAPEWLPAEILEKYDLFPLGDALQGAHFPTDQRNLAKSTERLKFDEIFLSRLRAETAKRQRARSRAVPLPFQEKEIKSFVAGLPFTLTSAQKVASWGILRNLEKTVPMNRLLSGDVGSGKTIVAAIAMYSAALNGSQTALMAPTEILAVQHYRSLFNYLGEKLIIGILTHNRCEIAGVDLLSTSATERKKEFFTKLKNGEIQVVVGTHALLSEGVEFQRLALVVVDEQHRFGVEQRRVIKEKGVAAHFLSMTATPIPRSLALVIYGELALSVIDEMPPGRKKIVTRLAEPAKRDLAYEFIRKQILAGRQVFVICPIIEAENALSGAVVDDKKAVMSEYKRLSEKVFPDLRVGYLHGKMKAAPARAVIPAKAGIQDLSKDAVMQKFKNGELDILVATSVVEVGVDIPNASVMMIENADRFGLAQLHQFRGRVGRAEHQSYCIIFTDTMSKSAVERLKYFEANTDGFKLAEKDLEWRGPGQVYGVEQSGMMNWRLAKMTDRDILAKAAEAARDIADKIQKYPALLKKSQDFATEVHLE